MFIFFCDFINSAVLSVAILLYRVLRLLSGSSSSPGTTSSDRYFSFFCSATIFIIFWFVLLCRLFWEPFSSPAFWWLLWLFYNIFDLSFPCFSWLFAGLLVFDILFENLLSDVFFVLLGVFRFLLRARLSLRWPFFHTVLSLANVFFWIQYRIFLLFFAFSPLAHIGLGFDWVTICVLSEGGVSSISIALGSLLTDLTWTSSSDLCFLFLRELRSSWKIYTSWSFCWSFYSASWIDIMSLRLVLALG